MHEINELIVYTNNGNNLINSFYRSFAQHKYGDENKYKEIIREMVVKVEMYLKKCGYNKKYIPWMKTYISGFNNIYLVMLIVSFFENTSIYVFKPFIPDEKGNIFVIRPNFKINSLSYKLRFHQSERYISFYMKNNSIEYARFPLSMINFCSYNNIKGNNVKIVREHNEILPYAEIIDD